MFVRFRQRGCRLNLSLVETRRVDGTVKHEHIAALGSVVFPFDVENRVQFWTQLHPRLDRLSNRLAGKDLATVLGAIHARIPMVSTDELRALKLAAEQSAVQAWESLRDMHAEAAEGHENLGAKATGAAAKAKQIAAEASEFAATAKHRVAQLERGEDIAAGIAKLDVRQMLRKEGWTDADMRHAINLHELHMSGLGVDVLTNLMMRHEQRFERRLVRQLLRGIERLRILEAHGLTATPDGRITALQDAKYVGMPGEGPVSAQHAAAGNRATEEHW